MKELNHDLHQKNTQLRLLRHFTNEFSLELTIQHKVVNLLSANCLASSLIYAQGDFVLEHSKSLIDTS